MDFNREFVEMTKTHIRDENCLILGEIDMNLMNIISVVSYQDFYNFSHSRNLHLSY